MPKRIGLLYGMERSFPAALAERVNALGEGEVVCEPLRTGALRQDRAPAYDVILDRISHEVPFYRTLLKQCAAAGTQVVNNPYWFSADDKYFGNIVAQRAGVAVPKTFLLPHKDHPPGTGADSFSNLTFPLDWEGLFNELGFPIFVKPMDGGGWKDVYRCTNPEEFFAAYDKSHTLCMMAQEAIRFTEYFRCYGIGRNAVRVMRYDPGRPHHERYVRDAGPVDAKLLARVERDCLALCRALGYDFNTVEFAVRDGVPIAIDFTNPCPDADRHSVGEENFTWVVETSARFLVDRALHPLPLELTGTWPEDAAK